MTDPGRIADAQRALLCLAAEQAGAVSFAPPAPAGYELLGVLTAVDAVFHLGPLKLGASRVFYGWALTKGTETTIVVRGTADATEWWLDAQFLPRPHAQSGGTVEDGFWSIYSTMRLEGPDGTDRGTAAAAIANTARTVTVTGHSLGGALGTFLAADLGSRGVTVTGKMFASPKPGDAAYVGWAQRMMADCVSYRFEPDQVPDVPLALGYERLPSTVTLPDDARVKRTLDCFHHAYTYAWLLDPSLPVGAPDSLGCIAA